MAQLGRLLDKVAHRILLEDLVLDLLYTLLVIVVAKLILLVANRFIKDIFHNKQLKQHFEARRADTLATLIKSLVRYSVYFVASVTILQLYNVPVGSVLTTAGIIGVALAFGAQNLVRDVITGFFILFENQFNVGDQVSLVGITGIVEEMGLRITKVRDFSGQLHIIPNGKIERVTNFMGPSMEVQVDVPIAYEQPLPRVLTVLEKILKTYNQAHPELKEAANYWGIQALTSTGPVLRVLARTRPQQEWRVELELRRAILEGFAAAGIKPPLAGCIAAVAERP